MQKIVHTMRDKLGLPSTFTLTELEEAELTDGQGRALSAHKSQQAYEGYAKRTMERALSATRKRHAHRLANAAGTNIQNEPRNDTRPSKTKSALSNWTKTRNVGWGARTRTWEWRNQNPLPYHLATPHQAARAAAARGPYSGGMWCKQ